VAALTGQARDRLAAIDTAMRRLAEGSYGICGNCGQLIGAARLATCIDCA
jgi:RNA polymerase-binding transcription factor DksA